MPVWSAWSGLCGMIASLVFPGPMEACKFKWKGEAKHDDWFPKVCFIPRVETP
jgi:hypothetical protein